MKHGWLFLALALILAISMPALALADNEIHTIPFPDGYDALADGASSYNNMGDHFDSPYFAHPDFYNMVSTDTLTILPHFETYQQTTEWTCGPVSLLMALHYLGNDDYTEMDLADRAQGKPGAANPAHLVQALKAIGWDYETSPHGDGLEDVPSFEDPADFTAWVIDNLQNGLPILVDWIDWGWHWQVIIGYDTMGTDHFGDDVMIVADPYDTSDHYQDGYMIYGAERFYYMWRAADGNDTQGWVIAKPPQK